MVPQNAEATFLSLLQAEHSEGAPGISIYDAVHFD
jgi:hypothetical protein